MRRWLRLRWLSRPGSARVVPVSIPGPSTPATGLITIDLPMTLPLALPPGPRHSRETGVDLPPARPSSVFYVSEITYLARRFLDVTGATAYQVTSSCEPGGHIVTHYHFSNGYYTTSEDAAVDNLRSMLRAALAESSRPGGP